MLRKAEGVWEPKVRRPWPRHDRWADHSHTAAVLDQAFINVLPTLLPCLLLQAVVAFLNELVTRSAIREELQQPGERPVCGQHAAVGPRLATCAGVMRPGSQQSPSFA
jgi:hypothetical protein